MSRDNWTIIKALKVYENTIHFVVNTEYGTKENPMSLEGLTLADLDVKTHFGSQYVETGKELVEVQKGVYELTLSNDDIKDCCIRLNVDGYISNRLVMLYETQD